MDEGRFSISADDRYERLGSAAVLLDGKVLFTTTDKTLADLGKVALRTKADSVTRLNAISEQLAGLDFAKAPGFLINGLKREELIAANSMILHELYFAGLGEQSRPGPALAEAITRDFGGIDRWHAEFVAMGKAEGGGSGWVLLTWSPHDRRLVNAWAADHTTTLAGGQPILVLDMYEDADHMDYGAKAGEYVDAFTQAIRWSNADSLYERFSRG